MEEFTIFLKYPLLFQPGMASDCVINVSRVANLRVRQEDGTLTELPDNGDTFIWGVPERIGQSGYYYGGSNQHEIISRIAEVTQKSTRAINGVEYTVKVKDQKKYTRDGSQQHWNNISGFQNAIALDKINMAFIDSIPGLKQQMAAYTKATEAWWLGESNSDQHNDQHNGLDLTPQQLVKVELTPEMAEKLNKNLTSVIDEITKKKFSSYTMKTHSEMGMYDTPTAHLYSHPSGTTWRHTAMDCPKPIKLKSWLSAKQSKAESNEATVYKHLSSHHYHDDFDMKLVVSNNQEATFYAVLSWAKVCFTSNVVLETQTNMNGRNHTRRNKTKQSMYLPIIKGFTMHTTVPGTATERKIETIARVRDRTQKRKVQGGYRGAYQGVSRITRETDSFRLELSGGLAAIASGPPIRSFVGNLNQGVRLPMSKESYREIERPMTNIKPLEVGHLDLYRISEPPTKQVTGEILSDMQLPSMPEILLAIDSDIRVTSNADTYLTGEGCTGTCDKEDISLFIPPGLYVVKRKAKCCLGHDPGRLEYNAGFGDLCNEEITIRRMLSQLNVFYDEFRGNMVGNEETVQWSEYDSESSGSFLGRF